MRNVRNADKPSGFSGETQHGTLVYSTSTSYPRLSPDASRDLDDIIFSLSGDASLTPTRLDELSERVTRWATGDGSGK